MTPSPRPDYRLNLDGLPQVTMSGNKSSTGSSASSPNEQPAGSGLRFPLNNSLASAAGAPNGPGRAGAGSPSKEYGSRLFPKRAREIQAQEGVPPQIWGPPTTGSGHSTPLRETIPESPSSDNFPDFDASQGNLAAAAQAAIGSQRRARAGTVPSRFPAASLTSGLAHSNSVRAPSSRGTPPALSPYLPSTPLSDQQAQAGAQANAILSRYRAGSMPQRASLLGGNSPFGSSVFASNWLTGRERASTLQSIRSSDAPSSPRESPGDNDIRTLDYLGLVDTPQQSNSQDSQRAPGAPLTVAEMIAMNALAKNTANRFRSYSVNAKEKYADGDDYDLDQYDQMMDSGQITPATDASAAQAAAIHEAVRQHNLEVQAFANFASASRPRARTAGILDSPTSRALRSFVPTPSRLDNSMTAADLSRDADYAGLASAVQGMKLGSKASMDGFDSGLDNPTRSLWLGNIPSSTTISSLNALFGHFGPIEFARVLTHKSCGFVNFENIQSAIAAKAQYNGKEIFPGCGPVRIGFAKEQSTSNTPGGGNGAFSSPSPDPFVSKSRADPVSTGSAQNGASVNADTAAAALATPNLIELKEEVFNILSAFGANQDDTARMSVKFDEAMSYDGYIAEIPPVLEPTQTRVHDAPRLRDIRKRIDNNTCSPVEIESIAMEMLPEIAELSSDYLGNTVVQKLFEHCAEDTKEAMLKEIAPRLADIGVHKNGTWAAQKIIDVANTPQQITTIAEALRPYAVSLFLDQYGNYVIQCCLRFQSPDNNYIFDTMVARLWDVAQGRFGARAVRACLESHFATNDQKRLMAAAITLHSVQLATNSNGALLLTWFLDTCTFPRRRSVLAPRLIPHLVHLCTHKVAYLTVLKIINQRNEPEARDQILHALFMNEETLSDVVSDQACGATFIFKVLTTPFLDEAVRPDCVQNVRNVLIRLKAQPSQGYKRLLDEVGLSNRHGAAAVPQDGRSSSKVRGDNAQAMFSNMSQGYDSPDAQQAGYDAYNNIIPAQYTHSPSMAPAGMSPQLQYSQGMLPQQQMSRPPGFMNGAPGNGMPGAYGNAASPGPMFDPYRQGMASPAMMTPGYQQQQGFGMGGYGQYNGSQYMSQGQMAGNGGGRRGRVSGNRYEQN